jgi:hypothetical protein
VHDRPTPRADGLLNEAERKKLKDELNASRDRAARLGQPFDQPAKRRWPAAQEEARAGGNRERIGRWRRTQPVIQSPASTL